jgi:hypothetical protein
MSGNLGGQLRTLPFTGFTALPFIIVGLVLTIGGAILRKVGARKTQGASWSGDTTAGVTGPPA